MSKRPEPTGERAMSSVASDRMGATFATGKPLGEPARIMVDCELLSGSDLVERARAVQTKHDTRQAILNASALGPDVLRQALVLVQLSKDGTSPSIQLAFRAEMDHGTALNALYDLKRCGLVEQTHDGWRCADRKE